MAAAKKPALALAVFGKPKGGDMPPDGDADDAELPADFEDYAIEAFPELEGDTVRLSALYKAMKACAKGY